MAIVEMKRVALLGMNADRDTLLRVMQRFGCVQITEASGDLDAYRIKGSAELTDVQEQLARIRWAIGQLGRYEPKQGMLASMSMPQADEAEALAAYEDMGALMGVVAAVEACERRSGDLRGQEARIRAQMDQLLPWRNLDIPLERIGDTKGTVQFIGTVAGRELPALESALADLPATMERIGDERELAFVWVVAHRSAAAQAQEALRTAEFTAVHFGGETGTIAQLLDALSAEQRDAQAERDALEERLKALSADAPRLRLLFEVIAARADREKAAAGFAVTGSAFLMEGWAPAAATEALDASLREVSPAITFDARDPLEDEKPPTLLHNNRVVSPFETVVTSYSYPDPHGYDPTAVMAPFFACLFGMMLSDAGYGLVMVIAIPLMLRFVRPKPGMRKLMKVLFYGGIFTVIWGAVFNTWFGTNPSFLPTVIDTLNEPIPMLMVCIAVGVVHLFTGVAVAAYVNIRKGKYLDALFDQGLWVILLVGLALLLVPQAAGIAKWMAIGGAVGILLTAGRDKPKLISRLISGGGALYGISSWLSDLLSYMRLFGMGLATGVIGMVINMLVGLMMGNPIGMVIGVGVLVGGHLFNFAINALGAYVHSCRLQYIEFFSKFYEDGGDPFRPLAITPRYIAIRDLGNR